MIDFIIYDAAGHIIRSGQCQDGFLAAQVVDQNEFVLMGTVDLYKDYVAQGEVLRRPAQQTAIDKLTLTADGIDTVVFSGAPAGADIRIENRASGDSVSGALSDPDTFSTTILGAYNVLITCWPYLDWEAQINAI